jgi:anti-sigma factor RsiW
MTCRRAEVLLEAQLDGVLPARHRAAFEAHLAGCFACKQELVHARRVRDALRELPERFCDDAVTRRVLDRVGEQAVAGPASLAGRLRQWWGGRLAPGWQPMAAGLAVLALVVGVTHFLTKTPEEKPITQQEVKRAELQVRWVLAHLGEISRHAGDVVKKDVLEERVAAPTARAVDRALEDALAKPATR